MEDKINTHSDGSVYAGPMSLTTTPLCPDALLQATCIYSRVWIQGLIYVANECPTFARTMLMVGHKLTFSCQTTLNVRQNLSVLMKKMQILG